MRSLRRLLSASVLALAGCAGPVFSLGVTRLATVPGQDTVQVRELRGVVTGLSSGLLERHLGAAVDGVKTGLLASPEPGYAVQQAPGEPVVGARVSLVDSLGHLLTPQVRTTDARGAYVFTDLPPLPPILFVRVSYAQGGRDVTLCAPVRPLPGGGVLEADVDPASTLVAKKLRAMATLAGVELGGVPDAALKESTALLARAMSDEAAVLAIALDDGRAAHMLDTMLVQSATLSTALQARWQGVPGFRLVDPTPYLVGSGSAAASPTPTPTLSHLFAVAEVPSVADDGAVAPVEVGVRFRPKRDGQITALRFYKSALNTGTHVGSLWTLDGTRLASATFAAETASGWQEVSLSPPVEVTAHVTYVASYFAPVGHYAKDLNYFAGSGLDGATLQAPSDLIVERNGVFDTSGVSAYPSGSNAGEDANYWVDVAFSSFPLSSDPNAASIWSDQAVPGVAATVAAQARELGMKFRSDVAGYVTGARFYKSAGNTGVHIGNLWAADGTRLASADFTAETATGWQQLAFPDPVPVAAGTTYLVSYFSPTGVFAGDDYFFNGLSRRNGPLVGLESGTDGPNGVYQRDQSRFPDLTNLQTNYWVDPVFTQAAPPSPASASFWEQQATPQIPDVDASPVALGLKFRPRVNGTITGVRFYKSPGNTGVHVGKLWTDAGVLLTSETFTAETASGWQTVLFSTPQPVVAGTDYVASYACPNGHFSASRGYFHTAMRTELLETGTWPGFYDGDPSVFPSSPGGDASNYWVDPIFVP